MKTCVTIDFHELLRRLFLSLFLYITQERKLAYTLPSSMSGDWKPMEHTGKLRNEWTKLGRFSVTVIGCLAEGTEGTRGQVCLELWFGRFRSTVLTWIG